MAHLEVADASVIFTQINARREGLVQHANDAKEAKRQLKGGARRRSLDAAAQGAATLHEFSFSEFIEGLILVACTLHMKAEEADADDDGGGGAPLEAQDVIAEVAGVTTHNLPRASREDVLGFRHGLLRAVATHAPDELRRLRRAIAPIGARCARGGWVGLDNWMKLVKESGLTVGGRLSVLQAKAAFFHSLRVDPQRRSRRPELSVAAGEFDEAFFRLARAYVLVGGGGAHAHGAGGAWSGPGYDATDPGAIAALIANAWRCEAACGGSGQPQPTEHDPYSA